MAPFRLPFSSKKPIPNGGIRTDENAYPYDPTSPYGKDRPSLALNQKGQKLDEPNEFKLSSVNDSGEYLPPSPMEQRGTFWGGKSPSTSSTAHRSVFSENEPFSISRESFDSYRRSFDISGRSPIVQTDSFTSRTSMDSRRVLPRSSISNATFERPPKTQAEEAGFEDVGLNDDKDKQQPKKKGFLSRFGDNTSSNASEDGKHHFSNMLPGRKRGQSGTGSELNSMGKNDTRPSSKGNTDNVVR